jgi:hypothetical protein
MTFQPPIPTGFQPLPTASNHLAMHTPHTPPPVGRPPGRLEGTDRPSDRGSGRRDEHDGCVARSLITLTGEGMSRRKGQW